MVVNLGTEEAHIRGEKPTAARYDANMTDEERDSVRNLIYLCTDHHTIIDKVEADWPVAALMALKEAHEAWHPTRVPGSRGFHAQPGQPSFARARGA